MMKNELKWILPVALAVCVLCSGCEQSNEDTQGSIEISPSSVELMSPTNAVTLYADVSVSGGTNEGALVESIAFPLEWSVDNPERGRIVTHSGSEAVYAHTPNQYNGNTITVRDGYGRQGIAIVSLVPAPTPVPEE